MVVSLGLWSQDLVGLDLALSEEPTGNCLLLSSFGTSIKITEANKYINLPPRRGLKDYHKAQENVRSSV